MEKPKMVLQIGSAYMRILLGDKITSFNTYWWDKGTWRRGEPMTMLNILEMLRYGAAKFVKGKEVFAAINNAPLSAELEDLKFIQNAYYIRRMSKDDLRKAAETAEKEAEMLLHRVETEKGERLPPIQRIGRSF